VNWLKPPTVEQPVVVETEKPARPPAHESRIFNSGYTFAERKAARLAKGEPETPPRRFVSYGTTQRWLEPTGRTGRGRMITMELLVDVRSGAGFQRMTPHGTLEPLASQSGGEETVEYLGRINPSGGSGLFAPATADVATPIS
jgi:hypothetical protein